MMSQKGMWKPKYESVLAIVIAQPSPEDSVRLAKERADRAVE